MSVRIMRERRRVTWTRATTRRTTMCVRSRGKDAKLAKEQARKDQTEQGRGIEGKGTDEETMEERKEAIKASRAANLIGTVTKTQCPVETKARFKMRAKLDVAAIAEGKGTS